MSSIVICKLPKAGLGNQLFPLIKAHLFAELNDLPILITGYNQFKIGPWLRREKIKRTYHGYFNFQKSVASEWIDKLQISGSNQTINEPEISKITLADHTNYVFSEMPHWEDYFKGLKGNRTRTKNILNSLLQPAILNKLERLTVPSIGVHIRLGDFKKLKKGEDFSKTGATRTPERYFIEVIDSLRAIHGRSLPVSVFTDGYKSELKELFNLKNITLLTGNADLVDMLLLSKSKIIVTSAGSTFSYWSAFLSEAVVIMHPDHIHQPLRPKQINEEFYEGPMDAGNELLIKNIKLIDC